MRPRPVDQSAEPEPGVVHRSGAFPKEEAPTLPGAPAAVRRLEVEARDGWGFERGEDGAVCKVFIMCRGCLRPFEMTPPRFAVDEHGDVVASDEGSTFRCTTCDRPIGPLRLADWRLGRMGSLGRKG